MKNLLPAIPLLLLLASPLSAAEGKHLFILSEEGYANFGKRLAEATIKLIRE